MVNGHHDNQTAADGSVAAWRSEINQFLDEAKQELRGIIEALQSGSPVESEPLSAGAPPARRPAGGPRAATPTPAADANRAPLTEPATNTAGTPAAAPADHDDRLEQLKRRIEEQLRSAEQK